MRLPLALAALLMIAAAPPNAPPNAPAGARQGAPRPVSWRSWVDRLAGLLADPALPALDPAQVAPFFAGTIELPPEVARCRDIANYTPRATPFAIAVGAGVGPVAQPCAEQRLERLAFAVDNRSDADTDYLTTALTARFGTPATENVWFPQAGGQTVAAVQQVWAVGDRLSAVVLLEPDEGGGLVGVSIARRAPVRPGQTLPPPDIDITAIFKRLFK